MLIKNESDASFSDTFLAELEKNNASTQQSGDESLDILKICEQYENNQDEVSVLDESTKEPEETLNTDLVPNGQK